MMLFLYSLSLLIIAGKAMSSSRLRISVIFSSFLLITTLSGCSSTIMNRQANLTEINGSWLVENCTKNDWSNASNFNAGNCDVISNGKKKGYQCKFDSSVQRGLFKVENNLLGLQCGVKVSGNDITGIVYTDGSKDTSTTGKLLYGAAAVAVAAAVAAAANGGGQNNYSDTCPFSYGERPKWDWQDNGWHCRDANNGQWTHACKCEGQIKIDNWS